MLRLAARHGRGIGRWCEAEEVGLELDRLLSHEGERRQERGHDPHSENTPSAYSLLTRRSSRSERVMGVSA